MQSAAGKIIRRHRNVRACRRQTAAFSLSFRRHFKLRPAKFLHLKTMPVFTFIELTVHALRLEFDGRVAEVHRRGKFESSVKTTEDIEGQLAFTDFVADLVFD